MFKKGKKGFSLTILTAFIAAALCVFVGCLDDFEPSDSAHSSDSTYSSDDSASSESSDCAAKINNVYYDTLPEAIAAAKEGDAVTLINDVVLDATLVVDKKITLDLDGKNVSAEGEVEKLISIDEGADLTVTGEGKVTAPAESRVVLYVNGGKVTVEGGEYDGGNGGDYDTSVYVVSGEAVLNGGKFTTGADKDNAGNSVIFSNGTTGKITVNGGYFWTDYAYNGFYYVLNQKNSAAGEIKVYGGTFENYDPAGGDDNLKGNFVAEGYKSVKEEADGKKIYTVVKNTAVTVLNGVGYDTLDEAIEAANAGDTITFAEDIDSDFKSSSAEPAIEYDIGGITINLNDHTYSQYNFAHVFEGTDGVIRNGKVVSKDGGSYALFIGGDIAETTSFTLENVELTGGVNVCNATGVILKDLKVTATKYYAVWADSLSKITIEGGVYDAGESGKPVFGANDAESDDGDVFLSVITVEDCTAIGDQIFLDCGGKLRLKGGSYEVDPTAYLAKGYKVTTETVGEKTVYKVSKQ